MIVYVVEVLDDGEWRPIVGAMHMRRHSAEEECDCANKGSDWRYRVTEYRRADAESRSATGKDGR